MSDMTLVEILASQNQRDISARESARQLSWIEFPVVCVFSVCLAILFATACVVAIILVPFRRLPDDDTY